jgi:hypothetical protein
MVHRGLVQHGQEGARAQWHTHWSRAFSCSGARKLASAGGKGRGEHEGPVSVLTGARVVVWWPSDGNEVMGEEKRGGDDAQAWREEEKRGDGCGENWRYGLLL